MARPKKARTSEELDAPNASIDQKALAEAGQALTERGEQLHTIDLQFSIGGQYDYRSLAIAYPAVQQMVASGVLWLGRALILIKEHETLETFQAFLAQTDTSERKAHKYMQVALKVQKHPHLEPLGVSKVLELLVEDDDTLDALKEGGTLADLDLDAIDKMSVRELKEALRAERTERKADAQAKDAILARKDAKLNQQQQALERKAAELDPDQRRMQELMRAYSEAGGQALAALAEMEEHKEQILAVRPTVGAALSSSAYQTLSGMVTMLTGVLARLADED